MKQFLGLIAVLTAVAPFAQAIVYFEDGGSHVVDSEINEPVYVWDDLFLGAGTTVTFNSGTNITDFDFEDDSLWVTDTSYAIINDGTFAGDVAASSFGTIDIFGGNLNDDLQAFGLGWISVFGGSILDDVEAFGDGLIEIFGGTFGEDIEAFDFATIFISGGALGRSLLAEDDGLIVLEGSAFSVNGVSTGSGFLSQSSGLLSGTLADGTSFTDVQFDRYGYGEIELVVNSSKPVPDVTHGPIGLLGLLAVGLARFLKKEDR